MTDTTQATPTADHEGADAAQSDPSAPTSPLDATETWQVGRVRITKFVEMAVAIPGEMMLPEATTAVVLDHRAELGPHATDEGWLTFSVHGFVLDDGERRILVDGGVGNGKARPQPWFDHLDTRVLDVLAAAGYPPEAIDTVVATHLHVDHVGWFTRRGERGDGWRATFPHARHLVVGSELDHWLAHPRVERDGDHLTDSVVPVLDADLVDRVDPDHVLTPEIRLLPTPGHSPGHVSVLVESCGRSAVITGDLLHHPIQVLEPGWDGPFDEDVEVAAATRRAFLARFADADTVVLGTHVARPTAGRIVTTSTGWRWVPEAEGGAGRGASG